MIAGGPEDRVRWVEKFCPGCRQIFWHYDGRCQNRKFHNSPTAYAVDAMPPVVAPVKPPAEGSHDDAVGDAKTEHPNAAGVGRGKKPRRRSASRKPVERPVTDWVVETMINMAKTDGPNVLNISVKNMRRRLLEENPDRVPPNPDRDFPSDDVISAARLEVLDRLKPVSDR